METEHGPGYPDRHRTHPVLHLHAAAEKIEETTGCSEHVSTTVTVVSVAWTCFFFFTNIAGVSSICPNM